MTVWYYAASSGSQTSDGIAQSCVAAGGSYVAP
jgi:hypothetical protein